MTIGLKLISALVGIFLIAPIWYYLFYKILQAVNASELMWFLFWVYVPLSLLVNIMFKIAEIAEED